MKEVLRVYWFLLFLFLVTSLAHGQVRRDSASRIRFGTALPATCNPDIGSVFFLIDPGSPLGMHQCLATDTWSPMVGSMSGAGADNQVAVFSAPAEVEGTTAFTFDSSTALLSLVNDSASIQLGSSSDVQLHWEAADILAQRRGTNEQTFNLYKTFTDGSNYERLSIYSGGGPDPLFEIATESVGTGAASLDLNIEAQGSTGVLTLQAGTGSAALSQTALVFAPTGNIGISGIGNLTANGVPTWGQDAVADIFRFDIRPATSGTSDSNAMYLIGSSFDTFEHEHIWSTFVDVTSASANTWTLQASVTGFTSLTDVYTLSNTPTAGGIVAGWPNDVASLQLGAALDTQMHRGDAADIWEQRRGANPQEWRLYDNFVSHSDYDRLNIYIGGGPPVKTIEFEADSSDATQGISLLFESESNAFGDGSITLRADTGGATLLLAPSSAGDFATLTASEFTTSEDFRVNGLILNVGAQETTPGIGVQFNILGQGAGNFADSHSIDLIGAGQNANRATWRTFVDVVDITGNSLWTLQDDLNGGGFVTNMTMSSDGELRVVQAGPHAIAGTPSGAIQLLISDTFISDGSSTLAAGLFHTPTVRGASGDTTSLTGTTLTSAITTQTATESITDIAQLQVNEPSITDNLTGSITQASTVLITGAPTEGVDNFALLVEDGMTQLVETLISGAFTSTGASNLAHAVNVDIALTGAAGDTNSLFTFSIGSPIGADIITQTATESISDVAAFNVEAPDITDNLTGSITEASTVRVNGAPTEGTANYALNVRSGLTRLAGGARGSNASTWELLEEASSTTNPTVIPNRSNLTTGVGGLGGTLNLIVGGVERMEIDGNGIGFFGVTPVVQPAAYTRNATVVEDRTLLASASATATNNNNVLAALIADLQGLGLIQ